MLLSEGHAVHIAQRVVPVRERVLRLLRRPHVACVACDRTERQGVGRSNGCGAAGTEATVRALHGDVETVDVSVVREALDAVHWHAGADVVHLVVAESDRATHPLNGLRELTGGARHGGDDDGDCGVSPRVRRRYVTAVVLEQERTSRRRELSGRPSRSD